MSFYQNELKYLYEGSDKDSSAVYKVDPVLFSCVQDPNFFNTSVNAAEFIKKVGGASYRENKPDVIASIMQLRDDDPKLQQLHADVQGVSGDLMAGSIIPDNSVTTEIYVYLTRTANAIDFSQILQKVNEVIPVGDQDAYQFQALLKTIMIVVCRHVTVKDTWSLEPLPSATATGSAPATAPGSAPAPATGSTPAPSGFFYAVTQLSNIGLNVSLKEIIYNQLVTVCEKVLPKVLQFPVSSVTLNDFGFYTNGKNRGTYYKLRTQMIRELVLGKDIIASMRTNDPSQIMYVKRILVDTFLKSSYPLVQFLIIDTIVNHYSNLGDYVNTRWGVLAKSMFVYRFVTMLNSNTGDSHGYDALISSFTKSLEKFNDTVNIPKILNEVHTMSKQVVSTSQTLEQIKSEIEKNKINLGNVSENIRGVRAEFHYKVTEFWLVFSFILVFVVVCGVLIFMKLPTFVYFLIVGVLAIILIIQAINVIKNLISKN